MARVTKCFKCGLTQMNATGECRNCGAPLGVTGSAPRSGRPATDSPSRDHNPYVPPQAAVGRPGFAPQIADGLWRDGKILVASPQAQFPDRCVKCNQPASGYQLKRRLTWHPQGWYALILLNVLLYAIVATIIQKKLEVRVGLCESHRRRRLASIGLGLALPLLGAAGCTVSVDDPTAIWLGILGFIVGMVILIAGTSVLASERIDENVARIRGAGPAFLASLPPFHG